MTKFHPKPHAVNEFMCIDDQPDYEWKWVVLPSRSGIQVFQGN